MPAPDNLNWQPVQSSNLLAVAYHFPDPADDVGDLYVQFGGDGKPTTTYAYRRVPQSDYVAMLASDSKGKYLHHQIKGRYDYEGPL